MNEEMKPVETKSTAIEPTRTTINSDGNSVRASIDIPKGTTGYCMSVFCIGYLAKKVINIIKKKQLGL